MNKPFAVRVRIVKANGEIVCIEKEFTTEKARDRWMDKNEDRIVEVLAYLVS